MRIATPNLLRFLELFDEPLSDAARGYLGGKLAWHDWPTEPRAATIILNLQMHSWGHRFLYDPETLQAALARAGFESIQEFPLGESDDPELQNVEGRPQSSVTHLNAYETMVWQATKPLAR